MHAAVKKSEAGSPPGFIELHLRIIVVSQGNLPLNFNCIQIIQHGIISLFFDHFFSDGSAIIKGCHNKIDSGLQHTDIDG